jgi:hypothetical protein
MNMWSTVTTGIEQRPRVSSRWQSLIANAVLIDCSHRDSEWKERSWVTVESAGHGTRNLKDRNARVRHRPGHSKKI